MCKYRKVLLFVNRAVYIMSAAMLVAALVLTVAAKPVIADPPVRCGDGKVEDPSNPGTCICDTAGHFTEDPATPGTCICESGYESAQGGKSCVLASPPDDQVCPEGGGWDKVPTPGDNTTYTYTIPDGKQVVEVCYKAGDNTHTYNVSPTTGSIGITQDQFMNPPQNAYLGLSHASFRLQDSATATPTNTLVPTNTFTNTPGATATHTITPSATATFTATATETNTPTNTATFTPTATATNTPTETATATFTATPTDTTTPTETNTPTVTPDTLYVILQDPYCVSIPGTLMQWAVVNNNAEPFTVDSWTIDGVLQAGGFVVPVGVNLLTQTSLGTHTIVLYWENQGFSELEWTINSCSLPDTATPSTTPTPTNTSVPPTSTPVLGTATTVPTLPIPETGGAGGPIIPVTGADLTQPVNSWFFGGFGMLGFGLVLSGLRKMYNL